MITLNQIRERTIEAIKLSSLTQTEIAKRLGIKQQQISCYVHGKKMPTLETFANLCKILDADPAHLLCID